MKLYNKIGSLGWDPKEGESDLNKLLRSRVLATLGGHGDSAIVEEAKKRLHVCWILLIPKIRHLLL